MLRDTTTVQAEGFLAQRLLFRCEVISPIVLNQHKGSALRGVLFNSLRKVGCSRQELTSCQPCSLVEVCPVSFLLATVDEAGRRGSDVPRPFAIQPPLGGANLFKPGDQFEFGLTLFARSVNFLPYLVIALQQLERDGLGAKSEHTPGRWQRGTLRVREIVALNPLSGQEQSLFKIGERRVQPPDLPVTAAQVAREVGPPSQAVRKLRLTFHTPTRLVAGGKPLAYPHFPTLVQRLVERLSSLSREYGGAELDLDYPALMAEAEAVVMPESRVEWAEVRSFSRRQETDISLGGFVGTATYVGRFERVLPLLTWGQLTHVGKDATKGNGWYSLAVEDL